MTGSHGSSLAKMLGADTPLSLARTWSVLRQVRIRQREKWVFWYRCRQFRQPISFEREVTFRGNYYLQYSNFHHAKFATCIASITLRKTAFNITSGSLTLCPSLFACLTTLLEKYNHSTSTNIYSEKHVTKSCFFINTRISNISSKI